MADFDGERAFEIVLDRLETTQRDLKIEMERSSQFRAELSAVKADLSNARNREGRLEERLKTSEGSEKAFCELFVAAEAAIKSASFGELNAAVAKHRQVYDDLQIPF